MTKIIFIGATGTDIGKTYTTCILLKSLIKSGYKAKAIKPIISGFDENNMETSDSGLLLDAMSKKVNFSNIEKISRWIYQEPLPPHLLAEKQGQIIDMNELAEFCLSHLDDDLDFLLIEGAGGIMTPINYNHTMLDLAEKLNCNCLIIAGTYLGTLSHTITALTCISQKYLKLDGVILSESQQNYSPVNEVLTDFTKILPEIPIKILYRNKVEKEIIKLIL